MQRENNVQVWDVVTGQRLVVLKGHTNWVFDVAYSPDGRWLASTGRDGMVKLWNLATANDWIIPESDTPWEEDRTRERSHLSLSGDGKLLAAAQKLQQVALIDMESLMTRSVLEAGETIRALALSSDGKRLVIGTKSALQVWDVESSQRLAQTTAWVNSLCFSPDEHTIFAAVGGRVVAYAADDLATTRTIALPGVSTVDLVRASPDSKYLAILTTHHLGDIYLWDLAQNAVKAKFNVSRWTGTMAFSADGKLLAAGGGDWFDARSGGVTKLWNVENLTPFATFRGLDGLHNAVAFTHDGRTLAAGNDVGDITLWDLETIEQRITLRDGAHAIDCLQFSPSGHFLISGNRHEGKRLYRTASPEQVRVRETSVLAYRHFNAGDWQQAVIESTEGLKLEDVTELRSLRGNAHAELEQWPQAMQDFRALVESLWADERVWWRFALTQMAMQDRHGHRDTITALLKNHQKTTEPAFLELVAWAATLQDAGDQNWISALELALKVPDSQEHARLADLAIGAALLRGGCFQDAVEWMERIADKETRDSTFVPAYRCFLLATACARLGNQEQATDWYQEGAQLRKATLSAPQTTAWTRRLTLQLLAEEAELAVRGEGPASKPPRRLAELAADRPEVVQQFQDRLNSPPKQ